MYECNLSVNKIEFSIDLASQSLNFAIYNI